MISNIFFFTACSILLFQGLQLLGEKKAPLGTVPHEVEQPIGSSEWISVFLITWSLLATIVGLVILTSDKLVEALPLIKTANWLILFVYSLWVIFKGRQVDVLSTTTSQEHDHH
ncbi:MAG: hypothetical protein ACKN9J_01260 [Holophagaceae bacterium]|jgi:hypothetical protein